MSVGQHSTTNLREMSASEQKIEIVRKLAMHPEMNQVMNQKKTDRRSQRTQQLLNSALVELMLEKSFDMITVQDILDRANIGRSTFYGHYTSKDDLLRSSLAHMMHSLSQHSAGDGAELLSSLALLQHMKEFQRLYKAFVWGRGIEMIVQEFHMQLSQMIEQKLVILTQGHVQPTVPLPVLADFVAGAFLSLVRWWIEHNVSYTPEQIDKMFRQMVYPGVEAAINRGISS
jgi:AcrR family transcriptional regulator